MRADPSLRVVYALADRLGKLPDEVRSMSLEDFVGLQVHLYLNEVERKT